MKTIPRNTNKFRDAISGAKNITRYDLDTGFLGIPTDGISEFSLQRGKLKLDGNHFHLSVHANLWYEWAAA